MKSNPERTGEQNERPGNLLALALLAPIVGAVSGFLGAGDTVTVRLKERLA